MKRTSIHTVQGTLECLSGLHIGGSTDDLQIGGTDLPVIKHPTTLAPYVPGSSLKGRMRAELEKRDGRYSGRDQNEPCDCARADCPVCRLFGAHKRQNSPLGPTRILVRDAPCASGGAIEIKTENTVPRQSGAAVHPRKLERVASGATFNVEVKVQVYDIDQQFAYAGKLGAEAILAVVRDGLQLVEQTGLGGATSRGSGHVRIKDLKLDGKDWQ